MIKFSYFLGNVMNILSNIGIVIFVFSPTEHDIKFLIFLCLVSITTHITERTKNIQNADTKTKT
jgi:hypothetical protein